MKIFGSNIGVIIGDSGSLATGSISTGSILPGINFIYTNGDFTSSLATGSIAAINTIITETSDSGSRGEIIFTVSDYDDMSSSGSVILKLFHTGSNNEPRVGIGFNKDEDIAKTFEIKTKKDSAEGTEIVLEGSRTSIGAQIGDETGKINFVVPSGSFDNKFESGSLAHIKSTVKGVDQTGVQGRLVMSVGRNNTESPRDIWSLGYGDGTTGGGILPNSLGMAMVLTGTRHFKH